MTLKYIEKRVSLLLPWGVGLTTIFVLTGSISDPVNTTKLLLAGAFAGALLFVLGVKGITSIWDKNKLFVSALGLFFIFSIWAIVMSDSPLVQNIYGVYGRNTGLLTYCVLVIFCASAVVLENEKQIRKLLIAFLAAGAVNLTYGVWAWQFGDFVAWNNIYGNLLGTFGNPNFMGAFLGMLFAVVMTYTIAPKIPMRYRFIGLALLILISFEIVETHAVQGVVVSAGAALLCGFFWIWFQFRSKFLTLLYVAISGVLGIFAVLGALQIGPLTELIYKRSVSLRGAYWHAGIEMGLMHPFTGVGMDSYGNWYRRTRSVSAATDMPGAEVTSNAAHNVFLDFFAYGGFPLLVAYVAIVVIGLISFLRVAKRQITFNPLLIALGVSWICFQAQSLISINQIGLAIWGWVFTGALVAYERITRVDSVNVGTETPSKAKALKQHKNQSDFDSTGLRAFLGLIIGILISIPPFTADVSYQTALNARSAGSMEKSLVSNYFKPTDSYRLANTVQVFEKSNLPELARKYAQIGVEFNPDYTDAWKMLYYVTGATEEEKAKAKTELIRLDPLNPAWKELP